MLSRFLAVLCVVLCASLPLHAATVQYSSRQDIPTNSQLLNGLVAADFNGDGRLDLAVIDGFASDITVYINQGNGAFAAPVSVALKLMPQSSPLGLLSGDINEDGKQDLAVTVSNSAGISSVVLLGNGDGTFTQGATTPVPGQGSFVRLVDLNNDGHLDLLYEGVSSPYLALGDGKGNFTVQPPVSPLGISDVGLVVGDFNGDKKLDLLTVDDIQGPNGLLFHGGVGNGTYSSPITSQAVYSLNNPSVAVADFNQDGKLDVAIGSSGVVQLIPGNGDGTFQSGFAGIVLLPVAEYSEVIGPDLPSARVATADLDGNGTPDLVAADNLFGLISVLTNDGSGFSLASLSFSTPLDAGNNGLHLADLNGDGLPDIILTNYITGNITIYLSVVPKATPAITVQSSAAQALVGSTVNVAVQVKGPGSAVPTGTVTLTSGTTSFGQQTLVAGAASFTLSGLAAGQYPLTASYSGDAGFTAATSAALSQSITDFQLALATATQTVQAGSTATYALGLTALDGFTGPLAISCSGLPAGYTCSPSTTTLSAASATVNVVVSPPATMGRLEGLPTRSAPRYALAVLACAGLCFCGTKRRKLLPLLTVLITVACFGTFTGCSSGAGNNSTPSKPAPYTGTSTFTITVAASQGAVSSSHQVTATLIVQ